MLCINCGGPSEWVFSNTGVADQTYCTRHIPNAYRDHPNLTKVIWDEVETPSEEVESKPEVSEAPKPKPRTRKRTTAK